MKPIEMLIAATLIFLIIEIALIVIGNPKESEYKNTVSHIEYDLDYGIKSKQYYANFNEVSFMPTQDGWYSINEKKPIFLKRLEKYDPDKHDNYLTIDRIE